MPECKHGLDDEWCATCKHGPERKVSERDGTPFPAGYFGRCPAGDTIEEGDVIVRLVDGEYAHARCAP